MSTVPIQNLRSGVASKRPVATGLSVGEIAINYNEVDPAIYIRGSTDALVKVAPVYVATGAPNATPASGGASGNSIGEQWLDKGVTPPVQKVWDGSTWVPSFAIGSGVITNSEINASAAIAYSKLALSGSIVNADISASAAIGLSKLATGALPSGITVNSSNIVDDSIVNADISSTAAISYSKLSLNGSIVNADVSASAAIADSKLATISTAGKVSGNAITSGTISGSTAISTSGILATTNQLRAVASSNSNYIGFAAPASIPANVSFVLPSGDGTTGQFLSTNGGGQLSWATVSAGSTTSISEGNTSVTVSDTGGSENASTVINGSEIFKAVSSGVIVSGVVNASSTISDGGGNLRVAPANNQTSSYTLVASDTGKYISITTGGITVPANVFPVGSIVTIFNNSTNNQTITQGSSTTLRVPGTATTGNRTLAQYGVATILCVASNVFVISGTGVS